MEEDISNSNPSYMTRDNQQPYKMRIEIKILIPSKQLNFTSVCPSLIVSFKGRPPRTFKALRGKIIGCKQ
jgi:alkyl hydroperoxide reductase subunit AhpC